jgi:hypothetical protein
VIIFFIYGRFALSHLASRLLRLCKMWFPLVLCESCKGGNFAFAVWEEKGGGRKKGWISEDSEIRHGCFAFVWRELKFKGSERNCDCDEGDRPIGHWSKAVLIIKHYFVRLHITRSCTNFTRSYTYFASHCWATCLELICPSSGPWLVAQTVLFS